MTLTSTQVAPVSTSASSKFVGGQATPNCCDGAARHGQYEPLKMMRAIHVENFGGPEVLGLKSNLIVPPLTKTQVLVRVMYAGVNPVETYIREGQYSRFVTILFFDGTIDSTAGIFQTPGFALHTGERRGRVRRKLWLGCSGFVGRRAGFCHRSKLRILCRVHRHREQLRVPAPLPAILCPGRRPRGTLLHRVQGLDHGSEG